MAYFTLSAKLDWLTVTGSVDNHADCMEIVKFLNEIRLNRIQLKNVSYSVGPFETSSASAVAPDIETGIVSSGTEREDESTWPSSEPEPDVPEEVFKCKICGKQFGSRYQMTGHMSAHSRTSTRQRPDKVVFETTPVQPDRVDSEWWKFAPPGFVSEDFSLEWQVVSNLIYKSTVATSYKMLNALVLDRAVNESRAYIVLSKFAHLRTAMIESEKIGGGAQSDARIAAQKELMGLAKDGKVAFG